jgi:hypothetical protein
MERHEQKTYKNEHPPREQHDKRDFADGGREDDEEAEKGHETDGLCKHFQIPDRRQNVLYHLDRAQSDVSRRGIEETEDLSEGIRVHARLPRGHYN